ncbi:uncharacterized protein [Anser cygnoides]|uniref:uncharacterized protein isoform X2 n=1 Tax=Anser cygnoides TaxID=8845 RepID=UPI0034D33E40
MVERLWNQKLKDNLQLLTPGLSCWHAFLSMYFLRICMLRRPAGSSDPLCIYSISTNRCVLWDFTCWGWSAANPAQKLLRGWLRSLRLVRDCSKRHSLPPAAHSCKPRHSTKMLENSTSAWHPLRLDTVPRAQNKALDATRLTTPSRECDAAAAPVRDGSGSFRAVPLESQPLSAEKSIVKQR